MTRSARWLPWIYALPMIGFVGLIFAYPMLSLGYVVVAVVSVGWLGEHMTPAKIAGIALICLGVVLVTRSSV